MNADPAREQLPRANRAREIYLTFDDGPDEEWTPRILDLLAAHDASATFFVVGRNAEQGASLLRRMHEAGHRIGNHGYSHRHPWLMTATSARIEVRRGTDAIAQAIGVPPRHFRPPFGRSRPAMVEEAKRCGQRVVLWDLSAIDWGPFAKPDSVERRLGRARATDVVLLHDARNRRNHPEVIAAILPRLLQSFAAQGLVAATLPTR